MCKLFIFSISLVSMAPWTDSGLFISYSFLSLFCFRGPSSTGNTFNFRLSCAFMFHRCDFHLQRWPPSGPWASIFCSSHHLFTKCSFFLRKTNENWVLTIHFSFNLTPIRGGNRGPRGVQMEAFRGPWRSFWYSNCYDLGNMRALGHQSIEKKRTKDEFYHLFNVILLHLTLSLFTKKAFS